MKLLLLTLVFASGITCKRVTVFVCDSKYAKKYHYRGDCRGLKNCKHKIIEISLDSARSTNKTLCKWEYNQ